MVADIPGIVNKMRTAPQSVKFSELKKVCEHFFGSARQDGTSHVKFKTGIKDPAIVNIQADGNMAKAYQVRQVLKVIEMTAGK